ncbi:MAG: transposase [archaeon]
MEYSKSSEYVDKRDWRVYNEELVVRGTFYLDLEWVQSWEDELFEINNGKKGRPFLFPESLIRLQAVWHQWVDYRGIEGITRVLVKYNLLPSYADFSTINRRVNRLSFGISLPREGEIYAACDGTGMKMDNAGNYRQKKYGGRKKRILKVVLTADPINRKLLAVDVGIDGFGITESSSALDHLILLKESGKKVLKFWGDPGLDDLNLFNWLGKEKIKIAIKPRAFRAGNASKSAVRKKVVDDYMDTEYKEWAKKISYGMRWVGTEGVFSAVKRKFGESVRARKVENILKEAKSKFWVYDLLQSHGKGKCEILAK